VGDDLEREKAALQMLVAMNADGVILASGNEEIRRYLGSCPVPVVALDTYFDSPHVNAYIHCDYYSGGRMAAEHLLGCGCRNIVCIKGPQQFFSARKRYEGYRDVCREYGLVEQTVDCDYDFTAGLAVTEKLLSRYPDVDGVIACNDIVAISIYKILHKKSISVPDQIQLIGFDDIAPATLISPELSTIRQPLREMAEQAAALILQPNADDPKGTEFILPTTLIVRETTRRKGKEQ
jgi:DNA-binding LacI/PurR family transcriptional regulator